MVVRGWGDSISVYSLPGLQLRDRVQMSGYDLRADSHSVVYVPSWRYLIMLKIGGTGNITVVGKLTVQGQLRGRVCVAVGLQNEQLCVGDTDSAYIYVVNITTDAIIDRLEKPPQMGQVWSVTTLPTGEILVADSENGYLAWYRSVSEPAVLLTDTPVTGHRAVVVGNIKQFLVAPRWGSQLYVLDGDGIWHTVNALNGEDGVWVPEISYLAVWENCVWVAENEGALVLLCPV